MKNESRFTAYGLRLTVYESRVTSHESRKPAGFTLIESIFIVAVIGISFFGFGYLFGNLDQEAVKADITVVATKLAREKMDQVIHTKAYSGYVTVSNSADSVTTSGWTFTRQVSVGYVNPADFSSSGSDTGYKKVDIVVSWGAGAGSAISLTTLVANMIPANVDGPGYQLCP